MIFLLFVLLGLGVGATGAGFVVVGAYEEKRREVASNPLLKGSDPKILPPSSEFMPIPVPNKQKVLEANTPSPVGTKEHLWEMCRDHEGGWLISILEMPLLIYGPPGSYKSSLASCIAMLRMAFKSHAVEVIDPHYALNQGDAWATLSELEIPGYGEDNNYQIIAQQIEALFARMDTARANKPWVTTIVDEFTRYGFVAEVKNQARDLIFRMIQDGRKAHEAVIIISHNNTIATVGNQGGLKAMIGSSLVEINLRATNRNGSPIPAFEGTITCAAGEAIPITLPKWIDPKFLLDNYSNLFQEVKFNNQGLEVCVDNTKSPSEAIFSYVQRKGEWLTHREVQRANLLELKGMNSEQIKGYLQDLATSEKLLCKEENNRQYYAAS